MSDLRQVDRVMLQTLQTLCDFAADNDDPIFWHERSGKLHALLTEKPEPCKYPDCDCDPIAYHDPCPAGLYRAEAREQPEPDAPQEVHTDDSANRILALRLCQAEEQRDQYKEKLGTLVGLVREYQRVRGPHGPLRDCAPERHKMFAYAEEVGGAE